MTQITPDGNTLSGASERASQRDAWSLRGSVGAGESPAAPRDSVELSAVAQPTEELPPLRHLEIVRRQIADGSYLTDERIQAAVDALWGTLRESDHRTARHKAAG